MPTIYLKEDKTNFPEKETKAEPFKENFKPKSKDSRNKPHPWETKMKKLPEDPVE